MVGIMVAGGTVASTACSYCSMAATSSTTTTEEVPVVLYQYEPCPYCCKVKAVLDYLSIPYHVVEVNPLTKKETKAFTDYKKVPVAKINGEVVVDSSAIIAKLRDFAKEQQPKNYNEGGVSFEEEEKWRSWVDQRLVRAHLNFVNIHMTHRLFCRFY
jgi:microsomal prostaglandin-E synthase 2